MSREKLKLEIDRCIIIGDAKRVEEEVFPIRNKLNLSIQLSRVMSQTPNTIYSKLYRYEKNGFYVDNPKLINHICKILRVDRKQLVKKF